MVQADDAGKKKEMFGWFVAKPITSPPLSTTGAYTNFAGAKERISNGDTA